MATILYVDDDHYLRDLVHYALTRAGCEVLLAHDGQEALRLLRTARLDLVLLEVTLPDMTGLEVLSTLRTFSRAPVVLLSTRTAEADVIAGFDRGADDYVAKPFSVQVLLQRVTVLLQRVEPRRAQQEPLLVDTRA